MHAKTKVINDTKRATGVISTEASNIASCIHECLGMYVGWHTWVCMFMYVCIYECMCVFNVCTSMCMHVYKVYSLVTVHIFDVTEQIWLPHENMSLRVIILYGHMDPTVFYICAETQPTTINTSHVTVIYMLEINMLVKFHIHGTYGNSSWMLWHNCLKIHVTYEFTANNSETRNT